MNKLKCKFISCNESFYLQKYYRIFSKNKIKCYIVWENGKKIKTGGKEN